MVAALHETTVMRARACIVPELLAASIAVAAAQGVAAVRLLAGGHADASMVVATFTTAAGIAALPLVALAAVATAVARTAPLVRAQRALARFASGGAPEMLGAGVIIHAAAIGEAVVWATIAARHAVRGVRVELGAIEAVVLTALALVASIALACVLVHAARPLVARARRAWWAARATRTARGWLVPLVLGAVGVATLRALLPSDEAEVAAWAWGAACVAGVAPVQALASRALSGARGAVIVATALVVSSFAYTELTRLPDAAELAVQRGPELDEFLLAVARRSTDRDGDGYSALLGGGDCDDRDARVFPGAHDVPGNGVDEDCSGADATPFAKKAIFDARDASLVGARGSAPERRRRAPRRAPPQSRRLRGLRAADDARRSIASARRPRGSRAPTRPARARSRR